VVIRVVETAAAVGRGRRRPSRAYQGEHDVAASDGVRDRLGEVDTRLNVPRVHENVGLFQAGADGVVEATSVTRGVVPPVADEHP
jgi:hypothetical protein